MIRLLFIIGMLALGLVPARATDNYQYGPTEYVTITDGLSPDGKYAITAHGEGEYGYDNFRIFLTNAKTGKKIGPLEEIGENAQPLDTGAASFCAIWSKNSEQVAIFYRISRQEPIQEISFRIAKGRAYRLKGPASVDKDYEWYWEQHSGYAPHNGKIFGQPLPHQPDPNPDSP